jgi:hypothetical protein
VTCFLAYLNYQWETRSSSRSSARGLGFISAVQVLWLAFNVIDEYRLIFEVLPMILYIEYRRHDIAANAMRAHM